MEPIMATACLISGNSSLAWESFAGKTHLAAILHSATTQMPARQYVVTVHRHSNTNHFTQPLLCSHICFQCLGILTIIIPLLCTIFLDLTYVT